MVTFEIVNANCYDNVTEDNPIPLDFLPNITCASTSYLPRSTIFACYTWLNPRIDNYFNVVVSPPDRKIEWRVEGAAPCRRLIISYYHIGSMFNPDCSLVTPATFEIVMYENTGLIDIYFENYSCPEFFGDGHAICGIQNWARNKGIAPPGKNATLWTAHQEGYRFTPSGGGSRFVSCKLYTLGGSFIANADTATNAADSSLLNVQFTNICPGSDTTQYLVQTSYTACATGNIITGTDTITVVQKRLNPVIAGTGNGVLSTGSFSSYQWLFNTAPIPGATGASFTATQSGLYQVVVTDSAGCRDTSLAYNFSVTPITLLNITAQYNNKNANIVNWQTSQEINTQYFAVQKAYMLPNFTTVATLPAAGNSNAVTSYRWADSNILYQPTFYRLRQADIDGRFTYSKTVQVNPGKAVFGISRVYPNPAATALHIEYNSLAASPTTLLVTDMLGRVVQQTILQPSPGFNKANINIAPLATGRYVIRLVDASGASVQEEFVKY